MQENPYRLADDIWGIGFKTADSIARNLGYDNNSYARIRSGIMYVLNQLSNEGHCFAYKEQLIEEAGRLLEVEAELIKEAIGKMLEEGSLIADRDEALYLPVFYHSETGAARRIKRIVGKQTPSLFIMMWRKWWQL